MLPAPQNIVLTPGDPAGIGPQVMLRAWHHWFLQAKQSTAQLLLAGAREIWLREAFLAKIDPTIIDPYLLTQQPEQQKLPTAGCPTSEGAVMAWAALDQAIAMVKQGKAQGIVTGPIAKKQMHSVGFAYPGHTEYLAEQDGQVHVLMVLSAPGFHVGLHTIHMPLTAVPGALDVHRMQADIMLLAAYVQQLDRTQTPLAICGLNPHAGEDGLLGHEEDKIRQAIAFVTPKVSLPIVGPLPGDTVFYHLRNGLYCGALAMYHDQGLGPFKMLHFHDGVNVTLGLRYIRTSPDHGTAFDLAPTRQVDAQSATAAVLLAEKLLLTKK